MTTHQKLPNYDLPEYELPDYDNLNSNMELITVSNNKINKRLLCYIIWEFLVGHNVT